MKFRGQGNAIPIALGVLAVVVAGSGTAVAVSSTTTISDPTVPSRIAHVDAAGQLLTTATPPTSSLAYTTGMYNSGVSYVSSPTTASLAITKLQLAETRLNGTTNGSDMTVDLVLVSVTTDGFCTTSITRYLATTSLSSGDHVDLASSVPFVTKANGSAPYCIALRSQVTNGATDVTPYFPKFAFAGYVVKGTYTGLGSKPTAAAPLPGKRAG